MDASPRTRTRPAPVVEAIAVPVPPPRIRPAPPIKYSTPMGYPVVGGPPRPATLAPEFLWPITFYHFTRGRACNTPPYVVGDVCLGMVSSEFDNKGKETGKSHLWRLADKTWRYVGLAGTRDEAYRKLEVLHERASAVVDPVQLVAPPARKRPIS